MVPCVIALYFFHGVAWWVALRGLDLPVRLRKAVEVAYVSQLFVFLPGGDLWRVPVLASGARGELDPGAVAGAVVFDDLLYFAVLTTAMLPVVPREPRLGLALLAALLPQLAIFTILLWARPYEYLVGKVAGYRLLRRFGPQLELIGPSFRRLFRPRVLVPVIAADATCVALAVALFWLGLAAVHAERVGLQAVMFTYSIGQLASGLSVLPAALGLYEGMMTGLLAIQGVSPAAAAAAALMYRAFNDVLMAVVGLLLVLLLERGTFRRERA